MQNSIKTIAPWLRTNYTPDGYIRQPQKNFLPVHPSAAFQAGPCPNPYLLLAAYYPLCPVARSIEPSFPHAHAMRSQKRPHGLDNQSGMLKLGNLLTEYDITLPLMENL